MRSRIRSAIRAIDERATRSPDLTCGLLAGVCRTSSPAARVRRSCRSRGVDVPVRTACSSRSAPASARFGTKIAIAVRADLEQWQKLNITAFLASGIASGAAETTGKPYEDGSGHRYLEMFRQPVLVYAADGPLLAAARERALARGMPTAIYTQELFATGNDDDNRAAVRAVPASELNLAGIAVHGPHNAVDKVLKGATLHK